MGVFLLVTTKLKCAFCVEQNMKQKQNCKCYFCASFVKRMLFMLWWGSLSVILEMFVDF